MRCDFSVLPHAPEDCPELRSSGPAGREVERDVTARAALPLAQAGDELIELEARLEGRGVTQITPPSGPLSLASRRPIVLAERRHTARRSVAAEELMAQLGALCGLAAAQGIDRVEADWMDVSALLLHVASLEAGVEWAAHNHGCVGEDCTWPDEMNRVMDEVLR